MKKYNYLLNKKWLKSNDWKIGIVTYDSSEFRRIMDILYNLGYHIMDSVLVDEIMTNMDFTSWVIVPIKNKGVDFKPSSLASEHGYKKVMSTDIGQGTDLRVGDYVRTRLSIPSTMVNIMIDLSDVENHKSLSHILEPTMIVSKKWDEETGIWWYRLAGYKNMFPMGSLMKAQIPEKMKMEYNRIQKEVDEHSCQFTLQEWMDPEIIKYAFMINMEDIFEYQNIETTTTYYNCMYFESAEDRAKFQREVKAADYVHYYIGVR